MSGSLGRSRSGDRFYKAPRLRSLGVQHQEKEKEREREEQERREVVLVQKQKQRERQERLEKQRQKAAAKVVESGGGGGGERKVEVVVKSVVVVESGDRRGAEEDCVSSSSGAASLTNLDRFLKHTTPYVPAQYLSKTSIRGWRNQEDDFRSYFVLGDLWESFKEWSAYGAGVPLLLNGSDSVVQYYVPYLSGMQLYVDPSKPSPKNRRPGEESDGDSSRDTSSEGSSDPETEAAVQGMQGLSVRSKPFNGSSSDDGETSSSPGALVFQYLEYSLPYNREPLADKISFLASQFPDLRTYRSCDLSPASWISVAWYPIYRIPTGPTLQNLDSCFLTFHSLSTPIEGRQSEWQGVYGSCPRMVRNGFDTEPKMSLPIFGLASYKFKISIWDQSGVESPRATKLSRAAEEWLGRLNVDHPDHQFFLSHSYHWR